MHRISLIINYSLLIVNYPRPLISLTTWLLCVAVWAQTSTFPLPSVPDTLQQEERLAYVLDHYWDRYLWSDATQENLLLGEQGLVDFLNLMQYADSLVADRCAASFVQQAFATVELGKHYDGLLEHYLYNQHSPLRNDLTYAHLLRHLSAVDAPISASDRQRYRVRLMNVEKNQVGSVAADFRFRDTDGRQRRLHEIDAPLTLLMFTDPECATCQSVEEQMKHEPLFHDSRLKMVRVLPFDDSKLKTEGASARDIGNRYFVPVTPAFYLLDANKRVLLKNATFGQTLQTLQELKREREKE